MKNTSRRIVMPLRPRSQHTTFFVLLLVGAVSFAAGCGDGRPQRVPVSGQVLIDGRPLTYGFITFSPTGSRPSSGAIDETGHFQLMCYEPGDGAVLGTHRVSIAAHEPQGAERIKWYTPKKYADPKTSGLTQEITGPTDSVVIELTWGGQKGPFIERP